MDPAPAAVPLPTIAFAYQGEAYQGEAWVLCKSNEMATSSPWEIDVDRILDRKHFRELFADRAIVLTDLGQGPPRDMAAQVNEAAGRADAVLHTRAEYNALFDAVTRVAADTPTAGGPAVATADDQGYPTPAGTTVHAYLDASIGKREFFDQPMYQVEISGWPAGALRPEDPVIADGSRLSLFRADPRDARGLPPHVDGGALFTSTTFSLVNSGQMTKYSPKRSWKVDLDPGQDDDRIVGMARLNLKAMYNDPSQMREALAWRLFAAAGVPSPRHTYAMLTINGAYCGLHSLIEQIDKRFLGDRFGDNRHGNLYKAYCGSLGCATLEHRRGSDGDDSGRQYHTSGHQDDQTYRLKTNGHDPVASYDDLATFVRVINGVGLPGGDGRFQTDAFRGEVERVFDVKTFLRWAGVNLLLGSWDNYFASPANYYLYNGGQAGRAGEFGTDPYFTFLPWDYDNSFGIDYFGTSWQYSDLLDWAAITKQYWYRDGHRNHTSRLPMVRNLFANPDFAQYYLDHLEYLLDTHFNPQAICAQMGTPDGDGLWQRVSQAAYLESDSPHGAPFTGRQFTNDEVFLAGYAQNELRHGNACVQGIYHYVKMRSDSALAQLQQLRHTYPAGASGATFPAVR